MTLIHLLTKILAIVVLFYSIIIHEVSHAFAAYALGDDSAKRAGRLSFNPLRHIDPFGTIILPLILYFSLDFVYGYAKPVPFNPYNFNNFKRDSGLTALAGPASNILIAVLLALVYHFSGGLFKDILTLIIFLNLMLAFFNLIPFPPLDGSKVLGIFLTDEAYFKWTAQERKGMLWLFGIILVSSVLKLNIIGMLVFPPVNFVMSILGVRLP